MSDPTGETWTPMHKVGMVLAHCDRRVRHVGVGQSVGKFPQSSPNVPKRRSLRSSHRPSRRVVSA